MVLFVKSDGEGERVEPRPRRARREVTPKRRLRLQRDLVFFRLRRKDGLSVSQISAILGFSETAVRDGLKRVSGHLAMQEGPAEDD
jgi:hypothetical protein